MQRYKTLILLYFCPVTLLKSSQRLCLIQMKFKDQIPNFITLLNLLCGAIAIILAFSGGLVMAGVFIFLAAIMDFSDGMAARLLHAKSAIGGQLDSLADVISFGMAPAAIMYQMIMINQGEQVVKIGPVAIFPFIAMLLVMGGAYRLAKFNTDPGQEDEFKGLPIPASGIFVASLPLIHHHPGKFPFIAQFSGNNLFLAVVVIFLSWIMISRIPMLSFKFKSLKWKGNEYRFILMAIAPFLVVFFGFSAVPLLILLYILFSIVSLSLKSR